MSTAESRIKQSFHLDLYYKRKLGFRCSERQFHFETTDLIKISPWRRRQRRPPTTTRPAARKLQRNECDRRFAPRNLRQIGNRVFVSRRGTVSRRRIAREEGKPNNFAGHGELDGCEPRISLRRRDIKHRPDYSCCCCCRDVAWQRDSSPTTSHYATRNCSEKHHLNPQPHLSCHAMFYLLRTDMITVASL